MKALIQRVKSASVSVDGSVVSSVGRGLCVLVGISRDDTHDNLDYLVRKVLSVRCFDNPESGKRWDKSVKDLDLEVSALATILLFIFVYISFLACKFFEMSQQALHSRQ